MYGRLSELGRISSRRYNLAMSVALGQHMDSVVVDDRATAFKAIDWLKRNRCVRVLLLQVDFVFSHGRGVQRAFC